VTPTCTPTSRSPTRSAPCTTTPTAPRAGWRWTPGRCTRPRRAASERYNTRFEDALARRLGVRFVDRADTLRPGKRSIREIAGVPDQLIRHFSKRRAAIEDRYQELAADYRVSHGHEPPGAAQLRLAQQATMETRDAKDAGTSLADIAVAGGTRLRQERRHLDRPAAPQKRRPDREQWREPGRRSHPGGRAPTSRRDRRAAQTAHRTPDGTRQISPDRPRGHHSAPIR
jgi:hypothetical protein